MSKVTMNEEQIAFELAQGHEQCVVEALGDGSICWDESDTREREPVYPVKKAPASGAGILR